MKVIRVVAACWTLLLLAPLMAFAQQPAAGQSEFVPVKDLPSAEPLPAAPLLVAAYAFVWVALLVYLWMIWRRLNKVESEMHTLERRTSQGSRAR